ncbi:MAG: AAA family ATPase [Candidatus Daviesbacteria bacterium]|nr:AAA family ATPase [Candidatus Daviesbacteria bacterium]
MDSAQNNSVFAKIKSQLDQNNLPADLLEDLKNRLARLEKIVNQQGYSTDLDRETHYLDFISSLPFNKSSQDILDLKRAAQILEQNHYGLKNVKERILEYLAVLILNAKSGQKLKAPVLAFVGLVGSGKTSLAYSIAEALGRKIIRIPLGGLGSISELRGQSKVKAEAEPGRLMKLLHKEGVNNPVILIDEIDRVAVEDRADIMGVLVELLDPEQNSSFVDYYVDTPFDLSKALFITTANNTGNIATAVLDRLEMIEMPSYTDEEKMMIGKNYILAKTLKISGLENGMISIDENIWPQIIRPLGFDAGIRSLQRSIEKIVRKVAKDVVEGNKGPYKISAENVEEYLR